MELQQAEPGPAPGPGIDMQQVQGLVNQMGASLSPGAQNLMDMVQFQQQVRGSELVQCRCIAVDHFRNMLQGFSVSS